MPEPDPIQIMMVYKSQLDLFREATKSAIAVIEDDIRFIEEQRKRIVELEEKAKDEV